MKPYVYLSVIWICLFAAGCLTPERSAGNFVKDTNFHQLQSFRVGEINLSGMPWSEPSASNLSEYTAYKLGNEIEEKGFIRSDNGADFIIRADWRKALKVNLKPVNPFGDVPELRTHDENYTRPRVMCSLTIELYDPKLDQIFWRAQLRDCVEFLKLQEVLISEVIEQALKSFPGRIEVDPNLPGIQ